MSFDAFVNTLIVGYVRHPWMQDEIKAAGIRLDQLPPKLLGKPTIDAYFEKRKTKSHELAEFELERDLDMLERFSESLTAVPRNPEVLRDKFKELYDAHQFQVLADELRAKPAQGKELIKQFQLAEGDAVRFQTLAELSMNVSFHQAQAKEHRSVKVIAGFEKLSHMIGGFNPERLGILLGGTGFGKTNAAINLSLQAAKTMRVAYVNMEMGYSDMVRRFAVIASGTSYQDYAKGNFEVSFIESALKRLGKNIFLTSGRTLSFDQIAAWLRLLSQKEPIDLLIIDYDQKVELNLKHQAEEWKALQKLVEAFEDLAKELSLYGLILAQINREGQISGSHRAQFPAHTVLAFYEHEIHGPIIEAKKNRHGKKNQALTVLYSEHNSIITEGEVVTLTKSVPERHKIKPKQQGENWWDK